MNESMNFVGCDLLYPEEKEKKKKKAVGVLVYRRHTEIYKGTVRFLS